MPAIRVVVAVLLMGVAAPAAAEFHLMLIREVYVGPVDDADAQYVELQMYEPGQHRVGGHSLTFYGPTGAVLGTVTFPMDVPNGSNQDSILVATAEAEARFTVNADLAMSALLDPAGGKVCFENIDCFSWGSFSGDSTTPSPSGNPFSPVDGLTPDSAALRDISAGSASQLEAADDTNDSAADFDFAVAPDPTGNVSGTPCDPEAYNCDGDGGGGGGGYGGGALGWLTSLLLLALGFARRTPSG